VDGDNAKLGGGLRKEDRGKAGWRSIHLNSTAEDFSFLTFIAIFVSLLFSFIFQLVVLPVRWCPSRSGLNSYKTLFAFYKSRVKPFSKKVGSISKGGIFTWGYR
jgi:hypothetical protein